MRKHVGEYMSRTAASTVDLHPLLAERWSTRAFDAAHVLGDEALTALLEAARWAPSAMNSQPWRFVVGRRGEPAHAALVALLVEGNAAWAARASALVLVLAEEVDQDGRPQPWAAYDTGQAVAQLTAQASALSLAVHQMGGFDRAGAVARLGLEPALRPLVVVAVGLADPSAELPAALAARETAPRTRRPLEELVVIPSVTAPVAARPAA